MLSNHPSRQGRHRTLQVTRLSGTGMDLGFYRISQGHRLGVLVGLNFFSSAPESEAVLWKKVNVVACFVSRLAAPTTGTDSHSTACCAVSYPHGPNMPSSAFRRCNFFFLLTAGEDLCSPLMPDSRSEGEKQVVTAILSHAMPWSSMLCFLILIHTRGTWTRAATQARGSELCSAQSHGVGCRM